MKFSRIESVLFGSGVGVALADLSHSGRLTPFTTVAIIAGAVWFCLTVLEMIRGTRE